MYYKKGLPGILVFWVGCSDPAADAIPTPPGGDVTGSPVTAGPPGGPAASGPPGAVAGAPGGTGAPGGPGGGPGGAGPTSVALEEGPWSIRDKKDGTVLGAVLALCKAVDTGVARCVDENKAPVYTWQEVPVSNIINKNPVFYWPSDKDGQTSWYVSVPKNNADNPSKIQWKETYGFGGDPTLEFKGIGVTVTGDGKDGYAAKDKHFRPIGPFTTPPDQTWAYAGGYFGNEKDSCFEVVSESDGKAVTGFLSVDYPDGLDGTVTDTFCLPEGFVWAGFTTKTSMTFTYSSVGACTCPEGSVKYKYQHKYK